MNNSIVDHPHSSLYFSTFLNSRHITQNYPAHLPSLRSFLDIFIPMVDTIQGQYLQFNPHCIPPLPLTHNKFCRKLKSSVQWVHQRLLHLSVPTTWKLKATCWKLRESQSQDQSQIHPKKKKKKKKKKKIQENPQSNRITWKQEDPIKQSKRPARDQTYKNQLNLKRHETSRKTERFRAIHSTWTWQNSALLSTVWTWSHLCQMGERSTTSL